MSSDIVDDRVVEEDALNLEPGAEGAFADTWAEPAGEAQINAPPTFVKRGRGRPKGYPKSGGRKSSVPPPPPPATQEEVNALLYRRGPLALLRLIQIGCGEEVDCAGPTGKAIKRRGTLKEQLHACEIIAGKLAADKKAVDT